MYAPFLFPKFSQYYFQPRIFLEPVMINFLITHTGSLLIICPVSFWADINFLHLHHPMAKSSAGTKTAAAGATALFQWLPPAVRNDCLDKDNQLNFSCCKRYCDLFQAMDLVSPHHTPQTTLLSWPTLSFLVEKQIKTSHSPPLLLFSESFFQFY